MPLYDFACRDCGADATILAKHGAPVSCPTCGSVEMARLLSPFAVGKRQLTTQTLASKHEHAPAQAHVHTASCNHSHAPARTNSGPPACKSGYVESVLKKYVP